MKPVKPQSAAGSENRRSMIRRKRDNPVIGTLQRHKAAFFASLFRLLATPFTSAMAIAVMAIAIALAGSFYILVSNAQQLTSSLQTGKQISLFLQEQTSDQQARALAQALRTNDQIAKVNLITRQQALAEFKQYSGFGAALDALENNPLPIVLQVYPRESLTEAYQLKQLVAFMEHQQIVDFTQLDMGWVARLQTLMQIASRFVVLLSCLLALAVIFITGNTIRSELQVRHDEVVITQLVGGTNAFICLPFLYAGFWYGLISGVMAWCIIFLLLLVLHAPVEQLSLLYQSPLELGFMNAGESAILVLAASMLGVIGALGVVIYQLRLLKPE